MTPTYYIDDEEPSSPPSTLIEPGQYPAVVDNAEVQESSAGNEYVKLTFKFDYPGSKFRLLWENLNFPPPGVKPADLTDKQRGTVNILKRRLQGLGLPYKGSAYPEGLTPAAVALAAKGCKATIDVRTEKDKKGQYPDKSAVFDIIPLGAEMPTVQTGVEDNEDAPF